MLFANLVVVILVVVLFFVAFLVVRTILFSRPPEPVEPAELLPVEPEVIAEHLAVALRQRTVSDFDRSKIEPQAFLDLRRELEKLYPRVHSTLQIEVVNGYSLLYTWKGKDETLPPALFAGHFDVVPVDPATRDQWKQAPFSGAIAEGFVWGRGALDTKCTVVAALEAAEALLKTGWQPERTLLLAFGHDEEIGGVMGASQIAGRLQASGVSLYAVMDEGSAVFRNVLPGVNVPAALIGIGEKGHLTLEMTVEGRAGHSAIPPAHTTIGLLSRAINRLEAAPLPARMGNIIDMFKSFGPYLPFFTRLALANHWLFGKMIEARLSRVPQTNAAIRTTTAVTMISGGIKDNILPARAQAAANFRLMPGDRIADVVAHVRKVIQDDAVQLNIPEVGRWEASPISSIEGDAYKRMARVVEQVFPEALPAPYLMLGASDARYYHSVCDQVFRFSPYSLDQEQLQTIHAANERIAVTEMARMVQFYGQIMRVWGAK